MLDKKQEYIAEALDEIRDAYIDEAVTFTKAATTAIVSMEEVEKQKKNRRFTRVFGTLVACMAVAIALGTYQQFGQGYGSSEPAGGAGMNMSQEVGDIEGTTDGAVEGTDGAPGVTEDMGTDPGNKGDSVGSGSESAGCGDGSAIPEGLEVPEDLLITSTNKPGNLESAVLKGMIDELEIVRATDATYIVVSVRATEVLDGDVQVGMVYDIWIPADVDYDYTAEKYLATLEEGKKKRTEYIFTPYFSIEYERLQAYRKDGD